MSSGSVPSLLDFQPLFMVWSARKKNAEVNKQEANENNEVQGMLSWLLLPKGEEENG